MLRQTPFCKPSNLEQILDFFWSYTAISRICWGYLRPPECDPKAAGIRAWAKSEKICRLYVWTIEEAAYFSSSFTISPCPNKTLTVTIDGAGMVQEQMGKNCNIFAGRTYNDVKNFWSTRKKRLERMLQTPTISQENNG